MQLPIIIIDDILHQNLQVSVWLQMVRHEMPPAISRLFPNWATCPGSKSKPFSRLGSRWGYQGIWGCLDMPSGFWYTDWYHLKQIGRLSPYHKQTPFPVASAICHSSSKLSINWVLRPFSFAFCNACVESKVLWPSLSKVSGTNELPEPIRIRNYV